MGIEIILKIAAVGILTSVVNHVLKYCGKDEISTLTTLAGIIVVLVMIVNQISDLFNMVKNIFSL